MKFFAPLVYLVTSTFIPAVVVGSGHLSLRLKEYHNSNPGHLMNGTCCNGVSGNDCSSVSCDPYFVVTITERNAQTQNVNIRYQTGPLKYTEDAQFFGIIGGVKNPSNDSIVAWPGAVEIHINVMDDNSDLGLPDGVIHQLSVIYTMQLDPKDQTAFVHIDFQPDPKILQAEINIRCDTDYTYDIYCFKYCHPVDNMTGHVGCSDKGDKVCLPGWSDDPQSGCLKPTSCLANTCLNGGTCTKIQGSGVTCACASLTVWSGFTWRHSLCWLGREQWWDGRSNRGNGGGGSTTGGSGSGASTSGSSGGGAGSSGSGTGVGNTTGGSGAGGTTGGKGAGGSGNGGSGLHGGGSTGGGGTGNGGSGLHGGGNTGTGGSGSGGSGLQGGGNSGGLTGNGGSGLQGGANGNGNTATGSGVTGSATPGSAVAGSTAKGVVGNGVTQSSVTGGGIAGNGGNNGNGVGGKGAGNPGTGQNGNTGTGGKKTEDGGGDGSGAVAGGVVGGLAALSLLGLLLFFFMKRKKRAQSVGPAEGEEETGDVGTEKTASQEKADGENTDKPSAKDKEATLSEPQANSNKMPEVV